MNRHLADNTEPDINASVIIRTQGVVYTNGGQALHSEEFLTKMRRMHADAFYHMKPIPGYQDGYMVTYSNTPIRLYEPHFDSNMYPEGFPNDWFYIGDTRFNVHPYRADVAGYPVRWREQVKYINDNMGTH